VPILLVLGPGLSLATVAANLLAAPLGEAVALPLCLTHALLRPLPMLERGVALVASGALALIREIARLTAGLDRLYFELPVPGCWHFATLGLAAAGVVALRSGPWLGPQFRSSVARRRTVIVWLALGALALAAVEWSTVRAHSAERQRELGRLTVTALDVGQGDSTLIDLPDGRLLLIDGGGLPGSSLDLGARVLLPVLRARRRSHLDLVVLSHPHPDHFGGLLGLVDGVSVGEFWYGGQISDADRSGPVADLVRRLAARGVVVRTAAELCRGTPATMGYRIEVLHPCPEPAPEASANDNSLVLRIVFAERAALFVGDAELWAEGRLLDEHPGELGADFLKVGHHGSRSSSSPAFIARVQPAVASVSAGLGNRFGHPHPETLATLAAAHVRVLRIDQQGSVEWQTDGERQGARVFADEP
jgi:competence protein ComEC